MEKKLKDFRVKSPGERMKENGRTRDEKDDDDDDDVDSYDIPRISVRLKVLSGFI